MDSVPATFPLLAPAALIAVAFLALRQPGRDPSLVIGASRLANAVALAVAAATGAAVALRGPWSAPVPGLDGIGFVIRVDALSAVMLGLVAFMGSVVLRFSRNYLDGDARHGSFLGRLALTVGSVMMLVLAGHLTHLVAFWALTSFALHRLLLFYPGRRGARVAARKKWLVARAGDIALAGAAILLVRIFGTGDIAILVERAATIRSAAGGADLPTAPLLAATLLVALSAALKSAQFPTHGWLAEVMETPTPVSALLHAGIINGGTFLVVRLGEIMLLTPAALHLLLVVGGFTALFGSVVLVTQSSVKVALAYSSAAHMGFMLLLCGLGAFPVAILHLVAHSFYKAHAFLSSGSAVETALAGGPAPGEAPSAARILGGMVLALGTVAALAALLGVHLAEHPVSLGLAGILAIGLTQLWTRGVSDAPAVGVVGRTLVAASATTLAFFTLEAGAAALLAGSVPAPVGASPTTVALMGGVVVLSAAVVLAQLRLPAVRRSPRWTALWVHLRNGLYANTFFDRLVGALRPVASPVPSPETR